MVRAITSKSPPTLRIKAEPTLESGGGCCRNPYIVNLFSQLSQLRKTNMGAGIFWEKLVYFSKKINQQNKSIHNDFWGGVEMASKLSSSHCT